MMFSTLLTILTLISGYFEEPAKKMLNILPSKSEFNTELSMVSVVGGRGVGKGRKGRRMR